MLVTVDNIKLAKERKKQNLSQHKLSLCAGLGGNAIYRLEDSPKKTSLLRLNAIADVLNIDVNELIMKGRNNNAI